ncbi:MAG: hypothetical protein HY996_11475 [Micrococcales bacterium]|nr:hypothetical protein [Micrococcales bacterium]
MTDVTIHVLRQIDIADSIDLGALRRLAASGDLPAGARLGPQDPATPGVVPATPPVDLTLAQTTVGALSAAVRIRVFDFGVVAVRFTFARTGLANGDLVRLGTDVAALSAAFDREARRLWQVLVPAVGAALTPGDGGLELDEDFTVYVLSGPLHGEAGEAALVHLLLAEPESRRLAPSLRRAFVDQAIRYYEDDLLLLSWDSAVIVEPAGALDVVNVLEIASAQLLEVRYYDAIVRRATAALTADAAKARTTWWLLRSPFTALARRAATLALEVGEIGDRLETAITLVGDSYTVTVYREAARRFRLVESRQAVQQDIETLAAVSETFGTDVHSRRAIVLEVLIILLILIEVLKAW